MAAGRRPQGRSYRHRRPRRWRGGLAVQQPGPFHRRHRRRPRRDDWLAPRPGAAPVRRGAARRVPARPGRRGGQRAPGRCRVARVGPAHRARIRAPAPVAHRGTAAFGEPIRLHVDRGRDANLSEPIEARLRAAGLPALPRTAWLEIDLDRVAANAVAARGALPADVRVDAVVKADAYGHGAIAVATWLERADVVDGLCVATLDEGLELRAAGVRHPLLVVYPIPPDRAPEAARHALAVTSGDTTLLDRMLATLVRRDGSPWAAPTLAIQLEVETGLGRGGFAPGDLGPIAARLRSTPGVALTGVWSHLVAPEDADRSAAQADVFAGAADAVGGSVPRVPGEPPASSAQPVGHLAATGGLLAATVPAWDSVRLGLGLYGIVPDRLVAAPARADAATALRPAMSLHARPVRVADLPAGHAISYGPSFETGRPSRIATLPLGYGDGWPRAASNHASALVRGRRVPLVGAVAMDAVMADVTDVPGEPVGVDDEFVLLGEQRGPQGTESIGVVELALARTTISWEVVTAMARRLPRVYHAAAVPVGVRTLTEAVYARQPVSSSGTATSATPRSTTSSSPPAHRS